MVYTQGEHFESRGKVRLVEGSSMDARQGKSTSSNLLSICSRRLTSASRNQSNDLENSGLNVVLTHTMYAIVGAIALERGGVEANEFAQQRILAPQGLGGN